MGRVAEGELVRLIVTGGQSGAAEAALVTAKRLGIPTAGFMPKSFRTETGPRPDLARTYGLEESPSPEYSDRAKRNILLADATLIFRGEASGGVDYTVAFAQRHAKPYLVVPLTMGVETAVERVRAWLLVNSVVILNVGGTRMSHAPGVATFVTAVLEQALRDAGAP